MALANFFDKTALAASHILQGFDRAGFEARLMQAPVELAFDKNAIESTEGLATLDLSIRLLARLYPRILFTALEDSVQPKVEWMMTLAQSINPLIELGPSRPLVTLVIGQTKVERGGPVFYIGSKGWTLLFSPERPQGSAHTNIPFAAGAVACIGAANVFRYIFSDQLENSNCDSTFWVSLLDFTWADPSDGDLCKDLPIIELEETVLVGLGAIGQGVVWALSRDLPLQGTLHLVDHERISLSNLQRYVLAGQADIKASKSELAYTALSRSTLKVHHHPTDWASFLANRANWELPFVMAAVDNATDRIAVQAALPRRVINGWTQPSDLGISRHFNFLEEACLACVYSGRREAQSDSELIAGSLGLSHRELELRELIYNNAPLSAEWIQEISDSKRMAVDKLLPFVGQPIRTFYQDVVCGGLLLSTQTDAQTETPMAFQSALAGILLASELVIAHAEIRSVPVSTMTRINLLRPLTPYLNEALLKPDGNRCLCQDADFRNRYASKYQPANKA